jgi:aldehyde:ferredoxin oxidoreductase
VDPFSPENVVVIAAGPLNGTPTPSASRLVIGSKSPSSFILGDTNSGGYWAPELKYAGFDAVVLKGRAREPVYLYIEDGRAELRPAGRFWGALVTDATRMFQQELGDDVHVLTIGPGGENMVRYACVVTDGEGVGGRCGIGGVLGSKNIKAVVVRGSLDVHIADPVRFKNVLDHYLETMADEVWTNTLTRLGTPNLTEHRQKLGIWGARNFQRATMDHYDNISGANFNKKYLVKPLGCMGCHVRCRRQSKLNDDGRSLYLKGPEYETINALAAKPFVTDPDVVLKAHHLCDEYGMDVHGVGSVVAMAMELYERGMLTREQTDGQEMVFGNGEALLYFIDKIANRQGFGDLMAEGTRIMGRRLKADYYAIHIKGIEVDATDPRKQASRALVYAVSSRGSCHLRANPYIDEFIKPEEGETFFGTPEVSNIDSPEGKGELVAWSEDWVTLSDLLGVCKFAWYRSRDFTKLVNRGLDLATEIFNAATGLSLTPEAMYTCGERVYNVERLINVREGIGRRDDYPPERFFREGLSDGPGEGCRLDREEYDRLLDDYYEARGWDKETGVPRPEKLETLGLK